MDVYQLIMSRRSVRSFKPEPIPRDTLERMVDTARVAPSGANLQPFSYLVVTEPEPRATVFDTIKWAAYIAPAGNPPQGHEPTAYVIFLIDERPGSKIYPFDAGFAAENLLITGLAEGVGGCAILSFNPKPIVETFSLPEHLRPVMVVALGYPDEAPVMVDRSDTVKYWRDENGLHIVPKKPLAEVMFFNRMEN